MSSYSTLSPSDIIATNSSFLNLSVTHTDILNACVVDLNYDNVSNISITYTYFNISAINTCFFTSKICNALITNFNVSFLN